jgi:hypothetical protein
MLTDRQQLRMPRHALLVLTLCWHFAHFVNATIAADRVAGANQAQGTVDFVRDIRPLLSDKCFFCHGPDADHREAGLRLDTQEGATSDLGGYAAIRPGEPAASELIRRVLAEDETERMPPTESGKVLTEHEIGMLKQWIQQGAPWAQHWAYVPPKSSPIPQVERPDWPRTWVDRHVLAAWEKKQMQPAADASPATLIRRLHFDLTGLPPSSEVVNAFVHDPSAQHYERLVDQLLSSPHFGERMAMYWLDLVRYADTVGYHGDQDHNISPYRDYVIDAFNRNLPFDQFTREQLAGDLLPDADVDQRIASGYNRLLQTSHEGGVQPKEYLAIYAADRVRNVSEVWMGATLGCAQCHDHKYDPFTTKDFYAMSAFFADIDEARHFTEGTNELPTSRPPEEPVLSRIERHRLRVLNDRLSQGEHELQNAAVASVPALQAELTRLQRQVRVLQQSKRLTMVTVSMAEPRLTRVLPRGNWLDESGRLVSAAVPEFLGSAITGSTETTATRQDLANWLVDGESGVGGLTARVLVNRFWYLFFGQGVSPVLADFGGQGEPPSNGALLDQLAVEFLRCQWDVKAMVRLIVTSRVYQLSSQPSPEQLAKDPSNRLFARQARFRLPAEFVRDHALAISGLLVNEIGGISAKPYQPEDYYRHLNFPPRRYHADTDRQQWRRGVYVHWQRQFLHPTFKALDAPNREECTAQRARSNTPLAALALLNDPSFVEAARSLAARILTERADASDVERIRWVFQLVTSREPDTFEVQQLKQLLEDNREHFRHERDRASKLLAIGLAPIAEPLVPEELAAWTMVVRACLNLHEVVTRN